jgi:hypothetical protein
MNPLALSWATVVEGLATALLKAAPDTAEIGDGPGERERLMADRLRSDGWTVSDVREARTRRKR